MHHLPITDGTDYTPVSTVLTYQPSSSGEPNAQCISIDIMNDSVLENTENFFVLLQTGDVSVTLTSSMAAVTILDDDGMHICMHKLV